MSSTSNIQTIPDGLLPILSNRRQNQRNLILQNRRTHRRILNTTHTQRSTHHHRLNIRVHTNLTILELTIRSRLLLTGHLTLLSTLRTVNNQTSRTTNQAQTQSSNHLNLLSTFISLRSLSFTARHLSLNINLNSRHTRLFLNHTRLNRLDQLLTHILFRINSTLHRFRHRNLITLIRHHTH